MTKTYKIDDRRGFADFDPTSTPPINVLYLDEFGNETTQNNAVIARYTNKDGTITDIDLVKLRKGISDGFSKIGNSL